MKCTKVKLVESAEEKQRKNHNSGFRILYKSENLQQHFNYYFAYHYFMHCNMFYKRIDSIAFYFLFGYLITGGNMFSNESSVKHTLEF